jgi:hypothetical protein
LRKSDEGNNKNMHALLNIGPVRLEKWRSVCRSVKREECKQFLICKPEAKTDQSKALHVCENDGKVDLHETC